LGIVGDRNLLVTSIYNVVGPIFNLFFIVFLLDRVGRKKPLLFGTIGITIALICRRDSLSAAGVFFLFLVSCIFSMSFGPISWVYASEILPLSIRGRGSAFATAFGNWLVGTVWSQVSPIGLGEITYKFYFIFVAFNVCVTFPTIWFVFKVRAKSEKLTEEIIVDMYFRKPSSLHLRRSICCLVIVRSVRSQTTWTISKGR
jgi:MFS family permease